MASFSQPIRSRRPSSAGILLLAITAVPAVSFANVNSSWNGPDGDLWSDPANWAPSTAYPNNGNAGQNYDVSIPAPASDFLGPQLDVGVVISNLTLVDRAAINLLPNTTLTVAGTTNMTTSSPGAYGIIATHASGTAHLGTYALYDATNHTVNGGLNVGNDEASTSLLDWKGADVFDNQSFIFIAGANSAIRDANTGLDAFRNISTNGGTLQFVAGHNFTTTGNFQNNGLLYVGGFGTTATNTTFTIGGQLTNLDSSGVLHGGTFRVDASDGGSATIHFQNTTPIKQLDNAIIQVNGPGTAQFLDGSGLNAFRNFSGGTGQFEFSGSQTINPNGNNSNFNNNGNFNVHGNSNITVQGGYTGGGNVNLGVGGGSSILNFAEPFVANGNGTVDMGDLGGELSVLAVQNGGGLSFDGDATLQGSGAIVGNVTMNGHLNPGHSPGQISITGSLHLGNTASYLAQLGGTSQGDQYDLVDQHDSTDVGATAGSVTLDGQLHVAFTEGFETAITSTDLFDILTSDHTLLGVFSNIASGDRLLTDDGLGSFLVTYANSDLVQLSNFQAVPEPTSGALFGGVALLLARRRRGARN